MYDNHFYWQNGSMVPLLLLPTKTLHTEMEAATSVGSKSMKVISLNVQIIKGGHFGLDYVSSGAKYYWVEVCTLKDFSSIRL